MNEMLSYIFGNLEAQSRALKQQTYINKKLNGKIGFICGSLGVIIAIMEIRIYEQNRKIDELNYQIEELKYVKGE